MKKFLVIRLSSLGDVVLASACVNTLRIAYPQAEIHFLTKSPYARVASRIPGVTRAISLDPNVDWLRLLALSRELDSEQYDSIIDLSVNLKSFFLSKLISSGATVRYGKRRLARERIVRGKSVSRPVMHTIDAYNQALRQLDNFIPLVCTRPILIPTNDAHSSDVIETLARHKESGRRVVFFSPGARHSTKRAPLELFAQTARELIEKHNCIAVWAYQASEGQLFSNLSSEYCIELRDQPIDTILAAIENSDCALTNDSGVMHLCSAMNTPVVALFGPTHPALGFAPRGVFDRVIQTDEYCRPCSLHGSQPCFREKRYCFENLTSQSIVETVKELISKQESRRPALFLDRDGNINEERHFITDPDLVELIPGVGTALRDAKAHGYALVIMTNQSGIARGLMTEDDVRRVNARLNELLIAEGVEIDGIYFSPYYARGTIDRYRSPDGGRKPSDKFFLEAAREFNLDLSRSWMIGDRNVDFLSARAFGGRSALVKTGYGEKTLTRLPQYGSLGPDLIAEDLPDAIRQIRELDAQ